MNQQKAVSILSNLTEEFQEPGVRVEDVLIKTAHKMHLPAAQLVKLAQVYNSAATLAHATAADIDDRGETPYVVDTKELERAYRQHIPAEKPKQRVKSAASIVQPTRNLNRFPSKAPEETTVKSAAAPTVEAPAEVTIKQLREDVDSIDAALFERDIAQRALIKRAASLFAGLPSPDKFVDVVQDAAAEVGDVAAYDVVKKAALRVKESDGRRIFRHWSPPEAESIPQDSRRVRVDRYGMAKLASMYAAVSEEIQVLSDMRAERLTAMQKSASAGPFSPEGVASSLGGGVNMAPAYGVRPAGPPTVDAYTRSLATQAPVSAPRGGGGILTGLGSDAVAGVQATGELIPEEDEFLASILSLLDTKGRRVQQARDMAASDTKRIGELQRLIVEDPVLSNADPKQVVAAYRTVQRANPSLLDDASSLSFVLREAVQYAGVPPHMRSDLIKQRSEEGRAQAAESASNVARYNPGADRVTSRK